MRSFFNQAGTSEPTIYAQYLYSGGQRVKKLVRTSGGGYESTSYVGGIYEYKTDGTDEQNTLNVQSIATVRTGDNMGDSTPAIKYNLEDNLGSSMTLLDNAGDFVNREEYYPFGETSFGSYALKRYRFQGKEKDTESGLYYFGARYYCAANCRFISVDAVLQPAESSYAGMGNNPINMFDPDGNMALDGNNSGGSEAEDGNGNRGDEAENKAKTNIGMPTNPKQGDTWSS